jgi:hypothetical protein
MRTHIEERAQMTSKRLLPILSALLLVLLAAAPAGASDSGGAAAQPFTQDAGGVVAPVPDEAAAPVAEAAQQETTPTTPGGEEQPPDEQPTETETAPNGEVVGPVDELPEDGAAGGSEGGLPSTGLEIAALAMIGLGLLMAGLALRPTSSWPQPRDRLSRSIPRR